MVIAREIRNRERSPAEMWGSGEGGESGGVDTSFEHADGCAIERNVVPHTVIEPWHAETA